MSGPAGAADPSAVDTDFPCYQCHVKKEITPWVAATWAESLHALRGVKCPDCHGNHDSGFDSPEFTALPKSDKCMKCHPIRVKETLAGKHANVTKCTSCHPRHTFSLQVARNPEICMTCHLGSSHVQSYVRSKMGVVYRTLGPRYSATCQTCHMPDRDHNVNDTVSNRELMLKVCNQCHAASFAGRVLSEGSLKVHW
ncbi:MAG TPA: multiheme c-type cytochrome [Nitrospirota bacterium]|nr:multiheme c-type cytochrome [Nitrospirota bacterium]